VSKGTVVILAVSVLAAVWAVAMMTPPGRVAYYYFFIYAEFYMGVLTLVSISITIMVGLVSTDRLVLSIRQRVMLQSVHRTTGVMAVSSLAIHLWTKTVEHHIRLIDIVIPFISPGNTVYVGLGTISGWILMLVTWTGIARARFIGRGKPWMWRSIHAISYLLWPIALVHGLSAGRPAKTWVTVSYVVCVLLVLIGLAVRVSVSLNRRKDFASSMGTAGVGGMKPVGSLVPTAAAAKKRQPRRAAERVAEEAPAPVAVLETWTPAAIAAPPISAPPEMAPQPSRGRRFAEDEEPMPASRQRASRDEDFFDEPTRSVRRRVEADFDYDEEPRPARGRRYADDDDMADVPARTSRDDFSDTSTRMRRVEMDDTSTRMRRAEMDDTSTRMRRADLDDTSTRMRRAEMDDTSTRMRRAEMDDTSTRMRRAEMDDTSTRMRRAEMDDTSTRMRRVEMDDTSTRMRRAEMDDTSTRMRRAEMDDTSTRMRRVEMDDTSTRMRRPDFDEPAGRMGRYAEDDEPAPRSRRRAAEPQYDDAPRGRRHADDDYDLPRQRGSRSGADARYGREEEDAPRARRDRGADIDRADSGRHSRSELVDYAGWAEDPNYLEPDETPTLVDMASRRARRASQGAQQEAVRGQAGWGARRGGRGRTGDDVVDDGYWSQLRGEAN